MAEKIFAFLQSHKGLPFRTMAVFNWLLEAALLGGLLILLVLLARALLRGKAGNRAVCLAWVLVAVRLLLPVALPNPLMNELKPTYSTDAAARPVADQFRVRFIDAASDLAWATDTHNTLARANVPYDLPNALSDVAAYTEYGWLGKWAFFAYVAGVGCVAVYMLCRNLLFRRRLRRSRAGALEGDALRAYHLLCDELGLMPPTVIQHAGVPDAMLVGVFRPYVALPAACADPTADPALRRALAQARTHANAWALVRDVCCALFWFHPLVWVAAYCSRADQLRLADERAVAALTPEDRAAYARRLLMHTSRHASPALCVLATPTTLRAPLMRRRAEALREAPVKPCRGAALALPIALGVLTLASFFVANTGFATPPQDSTDTGIYYLTDGTAWSVEDVPYSTAQFPDISVENAARYAIQDMIDTEGFPAEEINEDRMQAVFDVKNSRYVALYPLDRAEAGEAGRAYLDKWCPGQDECTLVWVFSDYDTLASKGRQASYQPDPAAYPIRGDRISKQQASDIAREALMAHWGMSEADAQAACDETQGVSLVRDDAFFEARGWPATYWKLYLTCSNELYAPCRVLFIDAETGRAFLFYDFVQNG